jgi:hypothetical protein
MIAGTRPDCSVDAGARLPSMDQYRSIDIASAAVQVDRFSRLWTASASAASHPVAAVRFAALTVVVWLPLRTPPPPPILSLLFDLLPWTVVDWTGSVGPVSPGSGLNCAIAGSPNAATDANARTAVRKLRDRLICRLHAENHARVQRKIPHRVMAVWGLGTSVRSTSITGNLRRSLALRVRANCCPEQVQHILAPQARRKRLL